jgi:hypothetical protein
VTILLIIIAVLLFAIALGHPGSRNVLSALLAWTVILAVAALLLALVAAALIGAWSLVAGVPFDQVISGVGSILLLGIAAWIVITLIGSAVQLLRDAHKRRKMIRDLQAGLLRAVIFSISCLAGLMAAGLIMGGGFLLIELLNIEARNSADLRILALAVPAALGPIVGIAMVPILCNRLERLFSRWTDVLRSAPSASEATGH